MLLQLACCCFPQISQIISNKCIYSALKIYCWPGCWFEMGWTVLLKGLLSCKMGVLHLSGMECYYQWIPHPARVHLLLQNGRHREHCFSKKRFTFCTNMHILRLCMRVCVCVQYKNLTDRRTMYRQIHYYLQNCTGTWKTVPSKCDWKSLVLFFFLHQGNI